MAVKITRQKLEEIVFKYTGRKVCYWGYFLENNYKYVIPRKMAFTSCENNKLISIKEETILNVLKKI